MPEKAGKKSILRRSKFLFTDRRKKLAVFAGALPTRAYVIEGDPDVNAYHFSPLTPL